MGCTELGMDIRREMPFEVSVRDASEGAAFLGAGKWAGYLLNVAPMRRQRVNRDPIRFDIPETYMRAPGVRNVTLQWGQYVAFIAFKGERTQLRFWRWAPGRVASLPIRVSPPFQCWAIGFCGSPALGIDVRCSPLAWALAYHWPLAQRSNPLLPERVWI